MLLSLKLSRTARFPRPCGPVVDGVAATLRCRARGGPRSVVVLFLVNDALRRVVPLVRTLWAKGGVSVVTLGGYHFSGWACDRWDLDMGIRIIDPKAQHP